MISDVSYAELHAFAAGLGIPRRAFERDHYDVIAERYAAALGSGAQPATSREIVGLLHQAGLRRRKVSRLSPQREWDPAHEPGHGADDEAAGVDWGQR